MPVWIVVSLLRTLIAISVSRIILFCVDGCASLKVAVSSVESHVAFPQLAVEVVVIILVYTILQVSVTVLIVTLVLIPWDGAVNVGNEGRARDWQECSIQCKCR